MSGIEKQRDVLADFLGAVVEASASHNDTVILALLNKHPKIISEVIDEQLIIDVAANFHGPVAVGIIREMGMMIANRPNVKELFASAALGCVACDDPDAARALWEMAGCRGDVFSDEVLDPQWPSGKAVLREFARPEGSA